MVEVDLVIRGGTVVDGSGQPAFRADVGVKDGRIVGIGKLDVRGRQEIDADGLVVSPGFIDGHTHMDAQVFWDQLGTCSVWHGVTSVVMGNCGFTLAPATSTPEGRALVVRNLERAEDISAQAMSEGIEWTWSTFPEYLDAVDRVSKGINYAANVGHSALRTWAMGERAFTETANSEDLWLMEGQLRLALQAGAIGFTTSQSPTHQTSDNRPVASRLAAWDEVCALVTVMSEERTGVFQYASPPEAQTGAFDLNPDIRADYEGRYRSLALRTEVPMAISLASTRPGGYAGLAMIDEVAESGGHMFGMTHCRGIENLFSFRTRLPFDMLPEWQKIRREPLERQEQLLGDEVLRKRLIDAANQGHYSTEIGIDALRRPDYELMYVFDHADRPNRSVAEEADRRGVDPVELIITLALESNFDQFFAQALIGHKPSDMVHFLRHPRTVMTFSDSGAHVSQIIDSSIQTYLLAYWCRQTGEITLEEAIEMITSRPARAWGLRNRGLLRESMAADINVFDADRVAPLLPEVAYDLPGGGPRLVQKANGFVATVVNGRVLLVDGEDTGERPGKLLRGPFRSERSA